MNQKKALLRALVYGFLTEVFLYPRENWTEDADILAESVAVLRQYSNLSALDFRWQIPHLSLEALQEAYRQTFGATGSLSYETEYGLPHEYRQSQELADIAGFYRAFGFQLGGDRRERPDHIAVELEFMHILGVKETYAYEQNVPAHAEICLNAQSKFLQDHLGRWIGLFAQSVAHHTPHSLYVPVAQFAADYVQVDGQRLGVTFSTTSIAQVPHTPFDPDFSCANCAVAGLGEQRVIRAESIFAY